MLRALLMMIIIINTTAGAQTISRDKPPTYKVYPNWPKTLPNNWILGEVSGIAVDPSDNIWIIHRPDSITPDEKGATLTPRASKCCIPAPPVIEFDQAGNLLRAWGGPGSGYDWPKREHGIYIDSLGNVWIGGNDPNDNMILKFDKQGQFQLQIGKAGPTLGSNDLNQMGGPAHINVDPMASEVFVADGYLNKRVIVFDSNTGKYKRHWGAYGNVPSEVGYPSYDPRSQQFSNPVHCVRLMKDNTLFVCDRANNRIQVFEKNGRFLRQIEFETDTKGRGSVWDLIPADSAQKYILVADGTNNEVSVLSKQTGEKLGSFGHAGRNAGNFHWIHNIAVDSGGNVYTSEVDTGKRVQKFVRKK